MPSDERMNGQKFFVRCLINRYNEELHIAVAKGVAPQSSAAAKIIEELVGPALLWMDEHRSEADIRSKLIWLLPGNFHDEGQEYLYFIQELLKKSEKDDAIEVIAKFNEVLQRTRTLSAQKTTKILQTVRSCVRSI